MGPENVSFDFVTANVFYRLLDRRFTGDGSLVSAKELQHDLGKRKTGRTSATKDPSTITIKRALAKLEKAGLVESMNLRKENSDPGPAPKGFRVVPDPPIVTWRSTAAILLKLYHHRDRRVRHDEFLEEVLADKIPNDGSREPLGKKEIEQQIEYCVKQGYIDEAESGTGFSYFQKSDKRLMTTTKVDDQVMFLEKLAGSSSSAHGGTKKRARRDDAEESY